MSVAEKGSTAATIWPVSVAIGVAAVLVGLIVNPLLFVPLGGAIALLAAFLWVRGNRISPGREQPPPAEREQPAERFPRNRLLERATLGLGGLVALGAVLPAAGLAVLPAVLGQRRRAINLGPIGGFPEGQFVIATFLADPTQGEISRRAAYVRNNGLLGNRPSFTIMSSRCTHVGCPTAPNGPIFAPRHTVERTSTGEVGVVPTEPAGGFGCPCHGSVFDTEGNRTAGPAPRALDRYQFSIRNGRLWLGDIYSVSRVQGAGAQARIHSVKRLGDGEPASGPESLLYPLDPIS
jgi:quinol---cytochrome c reductase iron-sulfur subunit, bacillus type